MYRYCAALLVSIIIGATEGYAIPAQPQVPLIQKLEHNQENVLLQESPLEFHAPEYNKISLADYYPAIMLGIEQHNNEIAEIINNPDEPSFENTIVALEKSGSLLNRSYKLFEQTSILLSNEEVVQEENKILPEITSHQDSVNLNEQLFLRIKQVHDDKDSLDSVQQRLVDLYYYDFVREGALLSLADKQKMSQINSTISQLESEFVQNNVNAYQNNGILVEDVSQLEGLTDDMIASLAAAAQDANKKGYLISLTNTTKQPILKSLKSRELREKIWYASVNRLKEKNHPLALKIAKLRAEKARLLGYENWADYVTSDSMAKTPRAVYDLLKQVGTKAVLKAKHEGADIQKAIVKDGYDFQLQPWDWDYYAEKVRKEYYDLNEEEIKPYFEFNRVLHDGLFHAANKLYGITMVKRNDFPVWHKDVLTYEVVDKNGEAIGLFYLDRYARAGKKGGAWMGLIVKPSSLLDNKPVVYNALNIPKPADGKAALMTSDEVKTMFHEFGHALHGLFSTVKYPSIAATNTSADFVEFPSQFNEDWRLMPEVMASYARHYLTDEQIPQELVEKIVKADKFDKGQAKTSFIAAALLDFELYSLTPESKINNVDEFEQQVFAKYGVNYSPVVARYKTAYFLHIFGLGYSGSYYAYLWTEVFAADAFSFMKQNGGLNRANGDLFRNEILSKGNSEDLMQIYLNFRGQEPTVDALLARDGFD